MSSTEEYLDSLLRSVMSGKKPPAPIDVPEPIQEPAKEETPIPVEQMSVEQILSQPLSTFGNAELNDLGKKYDNIKIPNQAVGGAANAAPAANDIPADSVLNGGTGSDVTDSTADDSVLNHNNNNQ